MILTFTINPLNLIYLTERYLFTLTRLFAAAKEREKALKAAANKQVQGLKSGSSSTVTSRSGTPVSSPVKASASIGIRGAKPAQTVSSPVRKVMDQAALDIAGLNLGSEEQSMIVDEPPPKISLAREKVLEEARKILETEGKKGISLVVIGRITDYSPKTCINCIVPGHVDAGKSTLMGRLLYEVGVVDEKKRLANERASNKIGKGSFSWAWEMDSTVEERNRY